MHQVCQFPIQSQRSPPRLASPAHQVRSYQCGRSRTSGFPGWTREALPGAFPLVRWQAKRAARAGPFRLFPSASLHLPHRRIQAPPVPAFHQFCCPRWGLPGLPVAPPLKRETHDACQRRSRAARSRRQGNARSRVSCQARRPLTKWPSAIAIAPLPSPARSIGELPSRRSTSGGVVLGRMGSGHPTPVGIARCRAAVCLRRVLCPV